MTQIMGRPTYFFTVMDAQYKWEMTPANSRFHWTDAGLFPAKKIYYISGYVYIYIYRKQWNDMRFQGFEL